MRPDKSAIRSGQPPSRRLFHGIMKWSATTCDSAFHVIPDNGYPLVPEQNLTVGAFQFPNFAGRELPRSIRGKCFESRDGKQSLAFRRPFHKRKTAPFWARLVFFEFRSD